jgi:hypothetical protein
LKKESGKMVDKMFKRRLDEVRSFFERVERTGDIAEELISLIGDMARHYGKRSGGIPIFSSACKMYNNLLSERGRYFDFRSFESKRREIFNGYGIFLSKRYSEEKEIRGSDEKKEDIESNDRALVEKRVDLKRFSLEILAAARRAEDERIRKRKEDLEKRAGLKRVDYNLDSKEDKVLGCNQVNGEGDAEYIDDFYRLNESERSFRDFIHKNSLKDDGFKDNNEEDHSGSLLDLLGVEDPLRHIQEGGWKNG